MVRKKDIIKEIYNDETHNKELSKRAKEFLKCLGNGKSMIEIEQEESYNEKE